MVFTAYRGKSHISWCVLCITGMNIVCMRWCAHGRTCVWKAEDNFWSQFSPLVVGAGYGNWSSRVYSKCFYPPSHLSRLHLIVFLETESFCAAEASLRITVYLRLTSNSQSCLSLPHAGITDVHHHTTLHFIWWGISLCKLLICFINIG